MHNSCWPVKMDVISVLLAIFIWTKNYYLLLIFLPLFADKLAYISQVRITTSFGTNTVIYLFFKNHCTQWVNVVRTSQCQGRSQMVTVVSSSQRPLQRPWWVMPHEPYTNKLQIQSNFWPVNANPHTEGLAGKACSLLSTKYTYLSIYYIIEHIHPPS